MNRNGRGSGRRVIVTGGASGLGFGIAEALLHKGARVALADIDGDGLCRAVSRLNDPSVVSIELDVTDGSAVRAAMERCANLLGGIDTLINCAGVFAFLTLDEMREEDWNHLINVNLKGVFLCCQAAAPFLRTTRRGRIVNIASDGGKKGFPLVSAYCASKFGVIGFSKAIAGEFAPYGVTVNCVCPTGVSSTPMGQQILNWLAEKSGRDTADVLASREQSVPLGRMASVEDVVNAVMFFVADESGFVTGEALNVDGGVLSTGVVPGLVTDAAVRNHS